MKIKVIADLQAAQMNEKMSHDSLVKQINLQNQELVDKNAKLELERRRLEQLLEAAVSSTSSSGKSNSNNNSNSDNSNNSSNNDNSSKGSSSSSSSEGSNSLDLESGTVTRDRRFLRDESPGKSSSSDEEKKDLHPYFITLWNVSRIIASKLGVLMRDKPSVNQQSAFLRIYLGSIHFLLVIFMYSFFFV